MTNNHIICAAFLSSNNVPASGNHNIARTKKRWDFVSRCLKEVMKFFATLFAFLESVQGSNSQHSSRIADAFARSHQDRTFVLTQKCSGRFWIWSNYLHRNIGPIMCVFSRISRRNYTGDMVSFNVSATLCQSIPVKFEQPHFVCRENLDQSCTRES